jgi:hypothetical protein
LARLLLGEANPNREKLMITSHPLLSAANDGCIETRFVLARCPAGKAHALQELIRAFQTDFPVPHKRRHRMSKKMIKTLTAPVKSDGLRATLARLGITRLEETPASA